MVGFQRAHSWAGNEGKGATTGVRRDIITILRAHGYPLRVPFFSYWKGEGGIHGYGDIAGSAEGGRVHMEADLPDGPTGLFHSGPASYYAKLLGGRRIIRRRRREYWFAPLCWAFAVCVAHYEAGGEPGTVPRRGPGPGCRGDRRRGRKR
jgi:hypothetical protein